MKKIISLGFLFCLVIVYGQNVSDYEYIYVPNKFKDFGADQYDLNSQLKKALTDKKYKVIQAELVDWPEDLRQNPCKVLNAEVIKNSSMLKNRVILQFTDCQKKVVLEAKGSSTYKEYDLGFQDALDISLRSVLASQPRPNMISSKVNETAKKEIEKEEVPVPTGNSSKPETYNNGKLGFQKIQISNDQFILVSSNSSVPFATFKNTTKQGVFRVKLENGNSTLGYYDNGNIVIEIPVGDGNYQKEIFEKK